MKPILLPDVRHLAKGRPHPYEAEVLWVGASCGMSDPRGNLPYVREDWAALASAIETVLSGLRWGHFAVFDYVDSTHDCVPYAQVAFAVDGYYCEVVSEEYVPVAVWPLEHETLLAAGWRAPDGATQNWWMSGVTDPGVAATVIASALSEGRGCHDASRVRWHVGAFPRPPDGGESKPSLASSGSALPQAA